MLADMYDPMRRRVPPGLQAGPPPAPPAAPSPDNPVAAVPDESGQVGPEDWKHGFARFMQGDVEGLSPELVADYTKWRDIAAAKQARQRAGHIAARANPRVALPNEGGQVPAPMPPPGMPPPGMPPGGMSVEAIAPPAAPPPPPGVTDIAPRPVPPTVRARDIRNRAMPKKGKPKIVK